MSWTHFALGAVTAVRGPRLLKRVVHTVTKGVMSARAEMGKAMVEAEKEMEAAKRASAQTPGTTGKA